MTKVKIIIVVFFRQIWEEEEKKQKSVLTMVLLLLSNENLVNLISLQKTLTAKREVSILILYLSLLQYLKRILSRFKRIIIDFMSSIILCLKQKSKYLFKKSFFII